MAKGYAADVPKRIFLQWNLRFETKTLNESSCLQQYWLCLTGVQDITYSTKLPSYHLTSTKSGKSMPVFPLTNMIPVAGFTLAGRATSHSYCVASETDNNHGKLTVTIAVINSIHLEMVNCIFNDNLLSLFENTRNNIYLINTFSYA